jgi:hypothetical protein
LVSPRYAGVCCFLLVSPALLTRGWWSGERCSERVLSPSRLLTPRYSISQDPRPYFILACNTPYYVASRVNRAGRLSRRSSCITAWFMRSPSLTLTPLPLYGT